MNIYEARWKALRAEIETNMEFNIKITERKPSQLNDDTWQLYCPEMKLYITGDSPWQAILRLAGAVRSRDKPEDCVEDAAKLFYYGTENPV